MGKIDPKKLWQGLKKYRYAALVLLLGLALLLLPGGKKTTQKSNAQLPTAAQTDYAAETERRLTQMLQQIAGAGQVSVMLTLETGERVEYQTDVQASSDGAQSSESRKTVILSEGSSYDKAAVAATTYPRFQGALIVCEGADSAAVRLRLLEAVSAVTGLSTDRITVVKMRS
ncbi:MAG: stage III sporulation protein AG [Oscillospiraceae bacterium]